MMNPLCTSFNEIMRLRFYIASICGQHFWSGRPHERAMQMDKTHDLGG